jgi:hypothetical protein
VARIILPLLIVSMLFVGMATSASALELEEGVTPPSDNGPVSVSLGIYVLDITRIDETRNTFDVELDAVASWVDPRLAFEPKAGGSDRKVFVGDEARGIHSSIWTAQIGIANPVGSMGIQSEKLTIYADGRVETSVQVNATCRSNLDYREFPFDSQVLPLNLESFAWNNDVVELSIDHDRTGFAPDFAMAEWEFEALANREMDVTRVRDATPFSNLVFEIRIDRKSGFFLWKIFLTVIIIVSLTFVVFWMSDERLGRRAGVSSSGILTVIAYQFVTTASLPRVSYLTVADKVMTVSIVIVAATMVMSIIVDGIDLENMALKVKIDRACRWAFPLAYFLLLALVAWSSGVL